MSNKIHEFSNFISEEDSLILINHMENNIGNFMSANKRELYHIQKFGNNPITPTSDKISDYPDILPIAKFYTEKAKEFAKSTYNDDTELYLSSFWLSRQLPGAVVGYHNDSDYGTTTYFKYSCCFYLNNTDTSAPLTFPGIPYEYKAKMGDMVIWPSQEKDHDHGVPFINETRYSMIIWLTDQKEFSVLY